MVKVRDPIRFVDERGIEHAAIVQHVWTETCINLVYVSDDESRKDNYGRQVEHRTSVQSREVMKGVPGFYWCVPEPAPAKA